MRALYLLRARSQTSYTNLRARRKLDFLRMTEVTFLSVLIDILKRDDTYRIQPGVITTLHAQRGRSDVSSHKTPHDRRCV